jgi:hypothetical protein
MITSNEVIPNKFHDRSMSDIDGPFVARIFYDELFSHDTIDTASVPYALDIAITKLRRNGATPERWAPFIHMGA